MNKAEEIIRLIKEAESIVITSHRSPDGDSVGSSLGMLRFVEKLNSSVQICHPDPMPESLLWVLDEDEIINADEEEEQVKHLLAKADLLFALDYNGADRMGEPMATWFTEATAKKIMIDHHLHPDDFVDVAISDPGTGSTSELVYQLIADAGLLELLDENIGTPLYLGIMTDTGSFRYSSVTPRTHEVLGELLRAGVNHTEVHEKTFDNNRLDKMRLRSHILSESLEVDLNYGIAMIHVTDEELKRFNYIKGDTDGLVNEALSLRGVKVAVFFVEKDGGVKISFRSKGDVSVNKIAVECFEGGGHKNASGGTSHETLNETINRFKSLIPSYFEI